MKRRRYEKGHWDSVICHYKEVELAAEHCTTVVERIRTFLEPYTLSEADWLPCHVIDLHPDGQLHAHVDSVRFSGNVVAGLSLLSSSIMRLKPADDSSGHHHVDLYLPPCSLYVLTGMARYEYTHELLPRASYFGDKQVNRNRRLSLLFRNAKVCAIGFKLLLLQTLMINAYHWNYRLTHMKRFSAA